ncbi:MAG: pyridoxamine 5'-phosphate oxidase, partial [Halothiobacillaceae bacterium]|nr:pyridoxamine 5'-phosphate oxidase [Halothiobacillaceae bacterium]
SSFLREAEAEGNFDPTSMVLATADAGGRPSARYVLLKHFDERGLCWYTDTRSRKGQELAQNPRAALAFYWPEMDRQVRIEGAVERLSEHDAENYFRQRPPGSRLAAAASHQSQPIGSREALEQRVAVLKAQYPDGGVPRNPDWGGYRLIPEHFEFWQGRESRMHDRFVYTRVGEGWRIERLMP